MHWGAVNKPIEEAKFDLVHRDMMAYAQDKELFVLDAWGGADPSLPHADSRRERVRLAQPVCPEHVSEDDAAKRATHRPEFTVIDFRSSRPTPPSTARARRYSSSCTSAASSC